MRQFIARGGLWVSAQLALFAGVVLAGLAHALPFSFAIQTPVAVVLVLVGVMFALVAMGALGPNLTPFPTPVADGTMVGRGPYQLVRHPIYTGVIVFTVGLSVRFGDWLSLALSIAFVPFFYAKTVSEERHLVEVYPDYEGYRSRVRYRLLPRIL